MLSRPQSNTSSRLLVSREGIDHPLSGFPNRFLGLSRESGKFVGALFVCLVRVGQPEVRWFVILPGASCCVSSHKERTRRRRKKAAITCRVRGPATVLAAASWMAEGRRCSRTMQTVGLLGRMPQAVRTYANHSEEKGDGRAAAVAPPGAVQGTALRKETALVSGSPTAPPAEAEIYSRGPAYDSLRRGASPGRPRELPSTDR